MGYKSHDMALEMDQLSSLKRNLQKKNEMSIGDIDKYLGNNLILENKNLTIIALNALGKELIKA